MLLLQPFVLSKLSVMESSRKYIPARNAAAPTIAKIPGEIVVTHWPTRRPEKAPASRAGMMIPALDTFSSIRIATLTDIHTRYLATERHYCQDELGKGAVYQPANVFWWRAISLVLANP